MKKLLKIMGILFLSCLFILLTLCGRSIATLNAFTQIETGEDGITGNLYTLDYKGSYRLGDVIEAGARDEATLLSAIVKSRYFGLPITLNLPGESGGSSFVAKADPQAHTLGQQVESISTQYLFGRNNDTAATDTLVVTTHPADGYASITTVDLSYMGTEGQMTTLDRIKLLAAPYFPTDGTNEQGLTVAALTVNDTPTAEDNGLPPITTTLAVRMILDRCATVDEALALLGNYDMMAVGSTSYHFQIADTSGTSVVVEYASNKMTVTTAKCATNYYLAKGVKTKNPGKNGEARQKAMTAALKKSGVLVSTTEATALLKTVSTAAKADATHATQWSILYDMKNHRAKITTQAQWDDYNEITLE